MTYRKRYKGPITCGFCFGKNHNRRGCRWTGFAIWSNGCEFYIAESAEHAAKLEADVMKTPALDDMRDELVLTPAADWKRVDADPLVLLVNGVEHRWRPGVWIRMVGRPGILAFADGEYAKSATTIEGAPA